METPISGELWVERGGEHAAPARDPTLLLDGVEEDERRVRDADDRRQRLVVRRLAGREP